MHAWKTSDLPRVFPRGELRCRRSDGHAHANGAPRGGMRCFDVVDKVGSECPAVAWDGVADDCTIVNPISCGRDIFLMKICDVELVSHKCMLKGVK